MSVHYPSTRNGGSNLLALAALLVTWALVHASLVAFRDIPVFETGLLGPDAYMRMVRVVELAQSGAWFDTTIARANAPYGDTLHWTRPFDVLVILLAQPVSFLLGPAQGLHVAGIVISPLLQLATGLLLIWALRPVIRPEVWFLPAMALFLQPCALAYSILGRADHHSLLLLVFVAVGGFMLRALRDPLDSRPALVAGMAAGFGVWLSVEFLLVVVVCLAAFGLPWLFGERERAAQGKWFSLGLSGVILAALFVERPLDRVLEPSYDSVSVVQYFLAVAILLFWRGIETFENRRNRTSRFFGRALLGILGIGAVTLLVASAFPLFFTGPMAGVDPRILPIWLDRVQEMRPLIPQDRHSLGNFLFYLGGVALIAPFFLKILAEARSSRQFFAYLFIALACLLLAAAAVRHMRFSGYAEIAFVFAFAVVLDRFLQWSGRIGNDLVRGLLRGGFIGLMLLGPILIGGTLMTKDAVAKDPAGQPLAGCKVREVAAYLESDPRWAAKPQTILAFMDIGPELLYRTHHRVVATPYHRNSDGIYDGYRMLATADAAAAHDLIRQRGVDLVLLCHTPAERAFYAASHGEENLYARLNGNAPPDWLAAVELPAPLQAQAQLYRVVR